MPRRRRFRKPSVIQGSSSNHFAKGGRVGGFLIAPTKLDPLSAARIEAQLAEKAKSGSSIIVADFGMKFEPFSATAVNQQLIEQLGWTEEKICEVFRMPISILNSSKQPPYANAEASHAAIQVAVSRAAHDGDREDARLRAQSAVVSETRIRRHVADLDGYD